MHLEPEFAKNIFLSISFIVSIVPIFYVFSLYKEVKTGQRSLEKIKSEHKKELDKYIEEIAGLKKEHIKLKDKIVVLKKGNEEKIYKLRSLRDKNGRFQSQNKKLKSKLLALKKELEQSKKSNLELTQKTKKQDLKIKTNDEKDGSQDTPPLASVMSKILEDEGMKEMVMLQVDQQVGLIWNDFEVTLESSLRDKFKQKLRKFQYKQAEAGMAILNMKKEERNKKSKELIKGKEALESEIKVLLGPENYLEYKDYKKTIGARQQLETMKSFGFNLDDELKKESILNMLIETQDAFGINSDGDELNQLDYNRIGDTMQNLVDRNKKLSKEYLIQAKNFLDGNEYEQFKLSLNQYDKTIEMGAKMSSAMFSNNGISK